MIEMAGFQGRLSFGCWSFLHFVFYLEGEGTNLILTSGNSEERVGWRIYYCRLIP